MKKLLPLILLLTLFLILQANTKSEIKNSGKFYFGTGVSKDFQEAKTRALSDLTKQISVKVATSFEKNLSENSNGLEQNVNSVMATHSNATLKNVQTIEKPTQNGDFEVFCYLAKAEVQKIFEERKNLIEAMCDEAEKNEKAGFLAHSLKLYYFASILLKSIPEQSVSFNGKNYTIEIPKRINEIISLTKIEFVNGKKISSKEKEITLSLTYKSNPISMLDFTFWDGAKPVSVSAKDGLANFRLVGESIKFSTLKLQIKYSYFEARKEFVVVKDLWDLVTKPDFKSSKYVSLSKEKIETPKPRKTKNWTLKLNSSGKAPLEEIENATIEFLKLISEGSQSKIKSAFSNDEFLKKKVLDYLKFNNPQFSNTKIEAEINKTNYSFELRKIQVNHSYPSINGKSTEFLALDFSPKGELIDFNVSSSGMLFDQFVQSSEFSKDWKERQVIIKFVEKYRTAYLTRDIATIDSMFAEDALILVGRKIQGKKLVKNKYSYENLGNQPEYAKIKLSKTEFIGRQEKIFKANEDIYLGFGTFDIIRKAGAEKVYGIEMRQNYSSTIYSDEGYLFLLIDFDEENPTIYVRAWQPNEWDKDAMIRASNFRVNK